jgi:hypothetical protein
VEITSNAQAADALEAVAEYLRNGSQGGEDGSGSPPWSRKDTNHQRFIRLVDGHLEGHGKPIVNASASARVSLSLCCALVEQESEGENIFEQTAPAPYGGQDVTPALVQSMVNRPGYKSGNAQMWGVGLTQLTYYTIVLQANALPGGAASPFNQCKVGFDLLAGYLRQYGGDVARALAAYNAGPGNIGAGMTYAKQVIARRDKWQKMINAAVGIGKDDPTKPKEGTANVLAHGVIDGTRFSIGYKRLLRLNGHMPYEIWTGGDVPEGPMAWAANAPLPPVEAMLGKTCFCAGVANIIRRDAGKIVPTRGNPHYDGGVAAYWYTSAFGGLGPGFFQAVEVPFNLATAKKWARDSGSGVLVGRSYSSATLAGQGHVAIVLPDGMVMQSFIFGNDGSPGLNIDYTIEQSHDGGEYQHMVHAKDWINFDGHEF